MAADSIPAYHAGLSTDDQALCEALANTIKNVLPEAESKIWHAHPVWFLDGNPIVGYSRLKQNVRLLFWSGQSFETPGLKQEGKFKAAEVRYNTKADIDHSLLKQWLLESKTTQWDYKNIVKRKGKLERLC